MLHLLRDQNLKMTSIWNTGQNILWSFCLSPYNVIFIHNRDRRYVEPATHNYVILYSTHFKFKSMVFLPDMLIKYLTKIILLTLISVCHFEPTSSTEHGLHVYSEMFNLWFCSFLINWWMYNPSVDNYHCYFYSFVCCASSSPCCLFKLYSTVKSMTVDYF